MNIADRLQFDRKHYFYYDLPLGYQITQERYPICTDGYIDIAIPTTLELASRQNQTDLRHSVTKRIRIARLQLEHDSAKSIHTANDATLVDLNRAGTYFYFCCFRNFSLLLGKCMLLYYRLSFPSLIPFVWN